MKSMMKNAFSAVIMFAVCAILVLAFPQNANAAQEGNYAYTVTDGKATITYIDESASGAIIIPSTLGGYPVESISGNLYQRSSGVTSVTISEGIKSIGDGAFANQSNLTSVTIPGSVTSIGNYAFDYCISLTDINISSGVTQIGKGAFRYCINLTDIVIPDSVVSMGDNLFWGCRLLSKVTISENAQSIGNGAFRLCSSLKKLHIPDSVTSIGNYAFDRCGILKNVTMNYGVEVIGDYAFNGCYNLVDIAIPESVISIGNCAFYGCEALTSVVIPENIINIGEGAFGNCTKLKSITVESWNRAYKDTDGVLFTADGRTLVNYPAKKPETSYVIPDSVIKIGSYAFSCCDGLTGVIIPESVLFMGDYVFDSSDYLTVYAEAWSRPKGWSDKWNCFIGWGRKTCPVIWGYGKVKGISLDKSDVTLLNIGDNIRLNATVTPENAYDKTVIWTSSDASVAIVDENGLVTAVENGICTITATTVDGGFEAACKVTVRCSAAPVIPDVPAIPTEPEKPQTETLPFGLLVWLIYQLMTK